jgi:putative flavoprotein involved in K+ transport
MLHATNQVSGAGGRYLSLQQLARRGVRIVGRLVAVDGERTTFDDSALANMAAGDAFAARVRAMIDDIIRRRGVAAPPTHPDGDADPIALDPPTTVDL